jgi:hypothetical protein
MTLEDSIAIRDLIEYNVSQKNCRKMKEILDKYHILSDEILNTPGGSYIFLGQVMNYFWENTHPDARPFTGGLILLNISKECE